MGVPEGVTAWACVSMDLAIQKTKQALRDRDAADSDQEVAGVSASYLDHSESTTSGHFTSSSHLEQPSHAVSEYLRAALGTRDTLPGSFGGSRRQLPILDPMEELSMLRQLQAERFMQLARLPNLYTGLGGSSLLLPPPAAAASNISRNVQPFDPSFRPDALLALLGRPTLPVSTPGGRFTPLEHPRLAPLPPANLANVAMAPSESLRLQRSPASSTAAFATPYDETSVDRAIRVALDPTSFSRMRDSRQSCLELSLVEVHLLAAMGSHGIPVWTSEAMPQEQFGWKEFGDVVVKVSEEWDLTRRESNMAGMRRISRSAMVEATVLEANLRELARKTIMLLESVRDVVNHRQEGRGVLKRAVFESWLDEELCRWAASLQIVGDRGRPVAYSSQTFLVENSLPEVRTHELITPMATFDKESCSEMFGQVACMSRLRSIIAKTPTTLELRGKVMKALGDLETINIVWRHRPSWWGAEGDSVAYDVVLLDKLAADGFRGVLAGPTTRLPHASLKTSSPIEPSISLQRPGLTKAGIQERVDQLVEALHVLQVAKDRQIILDDRKKRVSVDLGMATVGSATASEGQAHSAFAQSPDRAWAAAAALEENRKRARMI